MARLRYMIFLVAALLSGISYAAGTGVDSLMRVSILVASPGQEVYELEGHAGLRIVNNCGDFTVNWGLFDFNAPHFVYRFVKGETDYGIGVMHTGDFLNSYRRQGRGVTEIPLNLTPRQVERVVELVDSTLRPGKNVYRYNYVKDNCSTRPLQIIEQAVGDTVSVAVPSEFAGDERLSFRSIMEYYHRYYPWYQFGIDLALGSGIDYPVSPREMAFAPVLLPALLADGEIGGDRIASGPPRELIVAEPFAANPTPWYATPMFVACLVFAMTVLLTWRDVKRRVVSRWFDTAMYGLFGVLGCVTAFLVFVSLHEATSPNWLLLWLNPFALIPAVLVWIKSGIKMVFCYHFLNFVAITLLAIAWPFLGQKGNMAFVPLIMADVIRSLSYIYINRCALLKSKTHPA